MTSDHVHAWLPAYRDDELDAGQLVTLEQHLAGCALCRDELRRYDEALAALGALSRAPTDARHVDAVMARLEASTSAAAAPAAAAPAAAPRPWRRVASSHLAAALLGAAACLAWMLWTGAPADPRGDAGPLSGDVARTAAPEPGVAGVLNPPDTLPGDGQQVGEPDMPRTPGDAASPSMARPPEARIVDVPDTQRLAAAHGGGEPALAEAAPAADHATTPPPPRLVFRFDETPVVAALHRLEQRLDAYLSSLPARHEGAAPDLLVADTTSVASATDGVVAEGGANAPLARVDATSPPAPQRAPGPSDATPAPQLVAVADTGPAAGAGRDSAAQAPHRSARPAHEGAGPRSRQAVLRAASKLPVVSPAPLTVVSIEDERVTHMSRHDVLGVVVPTLLATVRDGDGREADLAASALADLRARLIEDPELGPLIRAAAPPPRPSSEPSWFESLLGGADEPEDTDPVEDRLVLHDRWWQAVRERLDQGL